MKGKYQQCSNRPTFAVSKKKKKEKKVKKKIFWEFDFEVKNSYTFDGQKHF